MTVTQWLEEWLKKYPEDENIVEVMREEGHSDESIKAFLEGI